MDPLTIAILAVAGFVAAFFDSIVGGGGIISLPALLAVGVDPRLALGTNKLAATGASLMATIRYTNAGVVDLALVLRLIPFAAVGSMFGAATVLEIDNDLIRRLVLVVMVLMTAYVVARPAFGTTNRFHGLTPATLAAAVGFASVIGFYDGFLGPGTGSFLIFAFVGIHGYDFVHAAGNARVLNFASNAAALAFFGLQGTVDYALGLPMLAAMVAGAYAGSHFGIRHGTAWVKPLFVAVTAALMAYLLYLTF